MERRKQQELLFNTSEHPEKHWCWAIEFRLSYFRNTVAHPEGEYLWGDWGAVVRPNHYRKESAARARVEELKAEHVRPRHLDVVEFRIEPKYLGYIPDMDEAWIV
jgi:hypothetical protein